MTRAVLVAGTGSGTGKTTVVLGLLAAACKAGLDVRSFKAGPDFIDPGLHELVTGRPAHTLDPWMMGRQAVGEIFARESLGADLVVVEGAMGLFDGGAASASELAMCLDLPVALVVDARGMGESAAAVVLGFSTLNPRLSLPLVFFNHVGSSRHSFLLEKSLRDLPPGSRAKAFALPRDQDLTIASRHLGLMTKEDFRPGENWTDRLADWFSRAVEPGLFMDALPAVDIAACPVGPSPTDPQVRLGLAGDEAFSFVYHENLRLLTQAGAQVVPFSPLHDTDLPPDLDGLWLPGGYPELHAAGLEANSRMRRAVAGFAASGRPVYAECGGLLYLGRSLEHAGQKAFLCGALDVSARMENRFQALGYREITLLRDCFLGPAGARLRGHEFHYARLEHEGPEMQNMYECRDMRGQPVPARGLGRDRVLGSFVHVHLGFQPQTAPWMVQWMKK